MYTTCLFCNGDLGRNEVIEAFPVGRRLAFDAAKGRLWVVCRRCERWNLTPLEERWEAIEACEREFRATKLRVSTDEIGLARVKEGLELVRIGAPQRPEMAAWRYGDQFGRRRKRYYTLVAGGIAAAGVAIIAGPMLGIASLGALNPAMSLFNAGRALYRSRKVLVVPDGEGATIRTKLIDVPKVRLLVERGDLVLQLRGSRAPLAGSAARPKFGGDWKETRELRGEAAMRAAGTILPTMNQSGGSTRDVQRAVSLLEEASSTAQLFERAALSIGQRGRSRWSLGDTALLRHMLPAGRLALEMAAHEETERRALEGELYLLEDAWRDAEEVAHIADNMFLPASMDDDLARLKRQRNAPGGDEPR